MINTFSDSVTVINRLPEDSDGRSAEITTVLSGVRFVSERSASGDSELSPSSKAVLYIPERSAKALKKRFVSPAEFYECGGVGCFTLSPGDFVRGPYGNVYKVESVKKCRARISRLKHIKAVLSGS